jgi:hypothetical protein
VLAWRIGYRAALLPLRDWSPRPDERLDVRRLPAGTHWILVPNHRTTSVVPRPKATTHN